MVKFRIAEGSLTWATAIIKEPHSAAVKATLCLGPQTPHANLVRTTDPLCGPSKQCRRAKHSVCKY